MSPKILIVLTSVDKIESTGKPIGWYLPELAHPYDVLAPKAELTIASPKGGEAPIDANSVELFAKDPSSSNFYETKSSLWKNTHKLAEFAGKSADFDAIFFPGGHGPMFDLVNDSVSQKLISDFYSAGKTVAAVCHGPAALLKAVDASGKPILEGRDITGFSNQEEDMFQFTSEMPFLLETELNKTSGGKYVKAAEPLGEKVVISGNVITGQNPASAKGVGEAIAKSLGI